MRALGLEVLFGDPEKADIVIFDDVNSQYVRKALNKSYRVAIFKGRPPMELRIGIRVAINVVRFLNEFKFERSASQQGMVRGALSQVWRIYLKSCLVAMTPRAVVTFIDTNAYFHWLSRHCREFPLIAIQNGARLRYASANASPGYYLQHLFCWGTHEPELFPDFGYRVEKYYPVGSLLASLHFDWSPAARHDKYDLLIVSAWRGNIGFPQDVKDTMRSMGIMDHLLARYIESHRIKAAVILRAERDSEDWEMPGIGTEFDYYRGIYGDSIEIIEADFTARSIYPVMQQSRLIVSCLSSAVLEAYGIGKKVLYCNFTGTDLYHGDFPSCIVINDETWEAFSRRLDDLLAQPQEEYQRAHKECAQRLMSFPVDGTTHELIAEQIDQIIEDSRCRG